MFFNCFKILIFQFLFIATIGAQIPATDLFLVDFDIVTNDEYKVEKVSHLSSFNQGGYTNQPAFMNDNEVYVSARLQGQNQNDIYSIDIQRKTVRQVTATAQSEYSPTRMLNGKSFACVREIIGDQINQKLYAYPLDQSTNGQNLLKKVNNVGYFAFTIPDQVALFLVDDVSKLAVSQISEGDVSFLSSNIGRCLRTTSNGSLLYVHKYTDSFWYLKKYDLVAKKASIISQTIPNREDFCKMPNGQILMGDGSKLYVHDGVEGSEWKLIGDLVSFGITNITRLAMNNRYQLVLVNQ